MCSTIEKYSDALDVVDDALSLLDMRIGKAEGFPLPFERAMFEVLMSNWGGATKSALKIALQGLKRRNGVLGHDEINIIIEEVRRHINTVFTENVENGIPVFMEKGYTKGKESIYNKLGAFMDWNIVDEDALYWLENHHMYWIGNYYDRQVSSALSRYVHEGLQEGLGRAEIGTRMKNFFNTYVGVTSRPDSYWRGLAANGMNRARNFGLVQGYVELNIQYLEILAVLDERTSEVCKEMNGKRIPVADAVVQRDTLMAMQDPEDVRLVSPFVQLSDIQNENGRTKAISDLSAMGVTMPPYHFNCRTTVVEVLQR